jgi:hypothetical protein
MGQGNPQSLTETTAPVDTNPTGGYDGSETACAGYSSPILPSVSGSTILYMAGTQLSNGKCEAQFGIDVAPGPNRRERHGELHHG